MPCVVVAQQHAYLCHEDQPFDEPRPEEDPQHGSGCAGTDDADDEPDPGPGHRADAGDLNDGRLEQFVGKGVPVMRGMAVSDIFAHRQDQERADSQSVTDVDMDNAIEGDQQLVADAGHLEDGEIHVESFPTAEIRAVSLPGPEASLRLRRAGSRTSRTGRRNMAAHEVRSRLREHVGCNIHCIRCGQVRVAHRHRSVNELRQDRDGRHRRTVRERLVAPDRRGHRCSLPGRAVTHGDTGTSTIGFRPTCQPAWGCAAAAGFSHGIST